MMCETEIVQDISGINYINAIYACYLQNSCQL